MTAHHCTNDGHKSLVSDTFEPSSNFTVGGFTDLFSPGEDAWLAAAEKGFLAHLASSQQLTCLTPLAWLKLSQWLTCDVTGLGGSIATVNICNAVDMLGIFSAVCVSDVVGLQFGPSTRLVCLM